MDKTTAALDIEALNKHEKEFGGDLGKAESPEYRAQTEPNIEDLNRAQTELNIEDLNRAQTEPNIEDLNRAQTELNIEDLHRAQTETKRIEHPIPGHGDIDNILQDARPKELTPEEAESYDYSKLDEILKNGPPPVGFEAPLEKEGPLVPIQKPMDIQDKTFVICLPGNDYSNTWIFYHLIPFLQKLGEWGAKFRFAQMGGSNICEVRETILGATFGKPIKDFNIPWDGKLYYDYMLWIDSDVLFTPENFEHLVRWDKPIVCGLYLKNQQGDFAPAKMDPEFLAGRANNIWSLNVRDLVGTEGTLIEVLTVSMGFALIKKGVFENVPRPWFPSMPLQMPGGESLFCGEDVCFSFAVRKAGFKMYIDPEVIIPHYKHSGWMAKIPSKQEYGQMLKSQQQQIAAQKALQSPDRQTAFRGVGGGKVKRH
jgi:hypothetical protein